MARKRSAESDADSDNNAQPKRARIDDPPAVRKNKGKQSERQRKSGPADSSGDEDDNDKNNATQRRTVATRNDEDFEKENAEIVRKAMTQKQTNVGAAEAGVISKLELHNFMCHKFVTFPFGPQVNFIIGHNGSGKSAALSAITVALGGKATSTGRAAGLKSFIKTGETAAEVTLTLKNGGHEPFKPNEYGNSIIITRHFTQNGSSSYKLKNQHGKTVSTKREELSAILDHFLIDVDNPMNILTQDLARQFLSASNPTEKYNLFLKGTLLTQLKEEYDLIRENCSKTKAVLGKKKENIEELEMRYKDAEARHQKAQNLADAQDAIRELKREMAWAHVADKEGEFSQAVSKTTRERQRLDQIKEKLEEAQKLVSETSEKINDAETRMRQADSPEELKRQHDELNASLAAGKEDLLQAKRDFKEALNELKGKNQALQQAEQIIKEEQAKLERDAEREQIRHRIEAADAAYHQAKDAHEQSHVDVGRAKEAVDAYRQQLEIAEREHRDATDKIRDTEGRVNNLRSLASGQGGPSLYGQAMPTVLRAIASTRWRGEKPIGPLGMHVRLKDNRWASALRLGIGNQLGGFAVTDYQDRATLRKILDDNGFRRNGITVAEKDLFDYSAGEAPPQLRTVLRVLDVSDEWVIRILINNVHIERLVLTDTRAEAERILDQHPKFIIWTADCARVQRYGDGGGTTSSIGARINNPNDFRNLLFTENREREELLHAQNQLQDLQSRYQNLFDNKKKAQEALRMKESEHTAAMRHEAQCKRRAKSTYEAFQAAKAEDVQEKPIDLAAQEAVAEELRSQMEELQRIAAAADATVKAAEARNKPLVSQLKEIRDRVTEHKQRQREIGVEAEEAAGEHMRAQTNERHYQAKLEEQQAVVARTADVERQLEDEYMRWRREVEQRYEEVKDPRPLKNLEKKLKAKEASLQRGMEEQGQSLEDIVKDLERAKLACDKAQEEFRDMHALVNLLRRSLATRMQTWQFFRQYISLRCKLSFQYYLSLRGFFGQIELDHEHSSLALKVQTDDQKSRNGKSREKDAKSMSGGEKSFATICLLLSLWDAMGCPIRALDEFDVYMDAVNRRISMKMMLEAAKNSDKQHILITPQDMGNVQLGPEVRIHRMNDPERGQQTLAFQR